MPTAAVADAQSSLQLEKRQASAALASAPLPGSATPLADRLGVQPWTLDLLYVGFRGFAVAAGAAIVLAYGAHGRRRPAETVLVEVERRPPPLRPHRKRSAPQSEKADRKARSGPLREGDVPPRA